MALEEADAFVEDIVLVRIDQLRQEIMQKLSDCETRIQKKINTALKDLDKKIMKDIHVQNDNI